MILHHTHPTQTPLIHIRRRAIRFPAKYCRIHAMHTCHQAASWGPPKTVENPCVSACPPQREGVTLIAKSHAYCRTLIKIGKVEDFTMTYCAGPIPARSGPWRPRWIPQGPPSKNVGFPCVSEVPPLGFHWRPRSPRCRGHAYRQRVTLIAEPL